MEIGTEISRKIRTAIKGKLQELGAYVDEELPDYIMVMVANKKSQEQMTDDLSLFLGNNTLRFTTWLQGVLDKLRAVTPGSNSLKASEAIIFNSSMPPLKSQSREDSGREPQLQRQEKFHSVVPSSSQVQRGSDRSSTDAAVAARLTSAVKPLQDLSSSEDIIDIKLDMDDAFNEDLSFSSESSIHPRKKPISLVRTQRPTAQVYRPPGSAHRLEERSAAIHRISQGEPIPVRQSSFHSNRIVDTQPYELQEVFQAEETFRPAMATERALPQFDGSRKRKIPVASSVVKVKRFLEQFEEEEEDEEEDDYITRVTALPSSVSIPSRPERRPTLPPSKQANKNLILKAISEAQKSITKTTNYSTAPPKQMVPVAPQFRPLPEEELILMKSRASVFRYQEEPEEAPDIRQVEQRRMDILSRLQPEPVEMSNTWGQVNERRMDILSRLHPEPVEETTTWGQDAEGTENPRAMDSRSFILKSPKVSKTSPMQTPPMQTPPTQTPPMQTPPTADSLQQFGRITQPRETPILEKPASPKFIVTLDGVPSPRAYHSEEEMEVDPMDYTEEGLYAEPQNLLSRAEQSPLMHPNSQDVRTSNDAAVPEKAKIHERCKYWPACKNAERCVYHHPTTVCKAFPKCRFADKCFFIHPNCKFDAKCTKTDCPYTHASKRIQPPPATKQEPAAKSHVKVQCRYFPSCKNTECSFFHPKHCRFSSHCTRVDCEFYHPTTVVPPRHALTWTRAQASSD